MGGTPLDIQKAFGLRVQQLRKETGMSQEKFALSIDMDRTYLASVEAGKRNISLNNIKKLLMVLISVLVSCLVI